MSLKLSVQIFVLILLGLNIIASIGILITMKLQDSTVFPYLGIELDTQSINNSFLQGDTLHLIYYDFEN